MTDYFAVKEVVCLHCIDMVELERQFSWPNVLISNDVKKIKLHNLFSKLFPKNRAVYEIIRKNIVEPDRPQMTTWRIQIVCCLPKTTNTHSEYVVFIVFPLQQW